jgi:CRISPR-associated helicase Cas3/CRISPR-associated endonuclease Cas3-HD
MILFAKKTADGVKQTIEQHMRRTSEVAVDLYDNWLPQGVRNLLPPKEICVFLAAAHDVGKASPVFQAHLDGKSDNTPRHWNISYEILRRKDIHKSLCIVLASHHGSPPDSTTLTNLKKNPLSDKRCGFTDAEYLAEQDRLFTYALKLSDCDTDVELSKSEQMLTTGFIILCDWIASSDEQPELPEAWCAENVGADEIYQMRFGYEPRAIQRATADIFNVCNKPGLIIIEAPMGEGKTEAALAAAEMMAARSERGGLFFALPTQATSNAMFSRVHEWLGTLDLPEPHTIDLVHGKKIVNNEYKQIPIYGNEDSDDNLAVHGWLKGRKKSLLADFVIGTIDHLLMGALKQKHVMLRHIAIAGKVVVIDECHAYDAYMDVYLKRVLNWLGEYRVPTVILSATLTAGKRADLINAYLNSSVVRTLSNAYPLITYTGDNAEIVEVPVHGSSRRYEVSVQRIGEDTLYDEISRIERGCIGVIVNTVKRAQEIYASLADTGVNVLLIHSRFIAKDRAEIERHIVDALGKGGNRPQRLIVVGTQVLEQSLDIDFDILFTEMCPMDLLIQRIGRLHRHERIRPEGLIVPRCMVMENELSRKLYTDYVLNRTKALLPDKITLPDDIAPLVNAAYDGTDDEGKDEYNKKIVDMEAKAEAFRLASPIGGSPNIADLLSFAAEDNDVAASASVRYGQDNIEVVIISEHERNKLSNLGVRLNAAEAMERSLRLPAEFDKRAVAELERNYKDDYGNLYLVMGDDNTVELCGYRLTYTKNRGLEHERI